MAGAGGAGACYSCRTLAKAWRSVTTPRGAARYLEARYGPHAAVQHMYGCPGLLKAVTRGAPRHAHDALALGMLRALCEAGCCAAGQTDAVLVPAAAAGHVTVAQWALQEGATALDRALRAACTHGHKEMVVLLLGALGAGRREAKAASSPEEVQDDGDGAGGDGDGRPILGVEHFPGAPRTPPAVPLPLPLLLSTALGDAATCGDRAVVELLLEAGADAQHDHSKALRNAATWGNEGAVAALLAAGADPLAKWAVALLAAAKHGHAGVVRQLLQAAAHEEGQKGLALMQAAHRGHGGVVQVMLRSGQWPQDILDIFLYTVTGNWEHAPNLGFSGTTVSAWKRGLLQEVAQELVAAGADVDRGKQLLMPGPVQHLPYGFGSTWYSNPIFCKVVGQLVVSLALSVFRRYASSGGGL